MVKPFSHRLAASAGNIELAFLSSKIDASSPKNALQNVINTKLRSTQSEIGDTLTMNSIGVGSCVYIASYKDIKASSIKKFNSCV